MSAGPLMGSVALVGCPMSNTSKLTTDVWFDCPPATYGRSASALSPPKCGRRFAIPSPTATGSNWIPCFREPDARYMSESRHVQPVTSPFRIAPRGH